MKPSWKKMLAKIKLWFWPKTVPPKGMKCPLCGARTVQYKRHLNRGMVLALAAIKQLSEQKHEIPNDWVGIGKKHGMSSKLSLWFHHREYSKLAWWKLVERTFNTTTKITSWRLTALGVAFLAKAPGVKVPAFFRVVHNKKYRRSVRKVDVDEAYGEEFNYFNLVSVTNNPWQWTLKPPKKGAGEDGDQN